MPSLLARQWIGAAVLVGAVIAAAVFSWWPFDSELADVRTSQRPSLWQLLFIDRLALGFARLIIVGLALYVATSVIALALAGRWLKGFGTTGLSADDAEDASGTIEQLERQSKELANRLDDATRQIDQLTEAREEARKVAVELYRKLYPEDSQEQEG